MSLALHASGAASRITYALRCHPTFFFSGALSPVPDLPGPVRLNPLSYGVDGLRGWLRSGEQL